MEIRYSRCGDLATGHSARDIFHLLQKQGLAIEAKPFALGVRMSNIRKLIDSIQYHCPVRDAHLPSRILWIGRAGK
jgi:uncharacterized FAD-dependent dehydrogenase